MAQFIPTLHLATEEEDLIHVEGFYSIDQDLQENPDMDQSVSPSSPSQLSPWGYITVTVIVDVDCDHISVDKVVLSASTATARDLYIKVSETMNISRRVFRLLYKSEIIPDHLIHLSELHIANASHVTLHYVALHQRILSGTVNCNMEKLDPHRQAIRQYAFGLPGAFVQSFFDAEAELNVRIPFGRTFVILKFQLETPLRSRTEDEDGENGQWRVSNVDTDLQTFQDGYFTGKYHFLLFSEICVYPVLKSIFTK